MLSLDAQERYHRRYPEMCPGWRPGSHVYQDLVAGRVGVQTRVLGLGCGRVGVRERLRARAGFVAGLDPDSQSLCGHRASGIALLSGLAEMLPFADKLKRVTPRWLHVHMVGEYVALWPVRS